MLFDSNLSFDSHVSSICKTDFFHLKNTVGQMPMFQVFPLTKNREICNFIVGTPQLCTLKNAGLFFQPKCWVETAG